MIAPHICPRCGDPCWCAEYYDGAPCACQSHSQTPGPTRYVYLGDAMTDPELTPSPEIPDGR